MNPEIIVVVPYHNEPETIEYTLEQIGEQSLPAEGWPSTLRCIRTLPMQRNPPQKESFNIDIATGLPAE